MNARYGEAIEVRLRPPQLAVVQSNQRFRMLVAGRRFGKTEVALIELFRAACARDRLAWYVAPTYKQAKSIAWQRLKNLTRRYAGQRISETDLRIDFPWGASIALRGADQPDSLRGLGLDFVVVDEYACVAPQAWTEVLRPALSDRRGRALFIGTPKGFNHFYEQFERAQEDPHWAVFQFTTEQGGNVTREELQTAARELDERTYRQEFQATFETLGSGRVYYAFERGTNVKPLQFNLRAPLCWSLDFNVNPMCSLLAQRQGDTVYVLDEIILPDSNTWNACEELLARIRQLPPDRPRPVQLNIYGDSTGHDRNTASSRTDWQIVKDYFRSYPDVVSLNFLMPSANPPVRDRVNTVNARLKNYSDERHLFIDPRCKTLIKDLERVVWRQDPHGNTLSDLDKSDPKLTHASDALGYLIHREFPMRPPVGPRSGFIV